MARMPGARWFGEKSPRHAMRAYDIFCLHTIVGHDPAEAAHFSTGGDGLITQSRDTAFQSAANLNGNPRVIASENEDMGSPFPNWTGGDVPAFTDHQIESNAQIFAWLHKTHGIPLQLCPNSRPGSKGLAYHRQGIDGNFGTHDHPFAGRVSGGEVWTLSPGKICPGDKRIAQLPLVLERAKQIVNATDQENHMNHVEAADAALKIAKRQISKAITELSLTPKKRVVARARIAGLKVALATVRAAEKALTK